MSLLAWLAVSSLSSTALSAPPLVETACSAIVQSDGGATTVVNDDNLKVLEQTRGEATFAYARKDTQAIRCIRNDLVPAVSDYKVLRAGFPLDIVESNGGGSRIGVLEVSGGQFRFRMVQGEVTADERQRLTSRLNEIQEAARPTS